MSTDVAVIPPRALPPEGGERIWITGDTLRILATAADTDGNYAFVPRGTVHRCRSAGPGVSRMLIAFTPGGLEDFFREAGTPAAGDGPPPPVDEAEIARTGVAAARHGLRVVTWDE